MGEIPNVDSEHAVCTSQVGVDEGTVQCRCDVLCGSKDVREGHHQKERENRLGNDPLLRLPGRAIEIAPRKKSTTSASKLGITVRHVETGLRAPAGTTTVRLAA